MEEDPETIAREVARALRAGRRAVAFTGAGVLWSGLALLGLPLAGDGRAWHAWPRVAHFFYSRFFLAGVLAAAPNACHTFLADCGMPVVTTNVDGLHERAGAPPEQVAAVHGTVLEEICAGCGRPLPDCARVHPCCGYPRPAALLFHDAIHPAAAIAGGGRAHDLVHAMQGADTPLLFIVGVSWALPTFACLLSEMRSYGARVIHVNLAPPPERVAAPGDAWVREPAAVFFGRCRAAYFGSGDL